MNGVATGSSSASLARSVVFAFAVAFLLVGTVAITIVVGDAAATLAPAALVVLLYALWTLPLRHTMLAIVFLGLIVPNPYEGFANGRLHTPLTTLGGLLLGNLNLTTGIRALNFTGVDTLLPLLFSILVYRRASHSRIDGRGYVETARPMRVFALVSLATNFGLWGWGLLGGGDFSQSMWQIHQILALPVVFFLCDAAFRGPLDHGALAKAIVAAALFRGAIAVFCRLFIKPLDPLIPHYGYATTHADSMLFAAAFAIVLAVFLERPIRKNFLRLVLIEPALTVAMMANSRRLAWVEVIAVCALFYLLSPWTRLKRVVTRAATAALPLLLVYVAAGWGSTAGIFSPVQTIRSMVDPETNTSTEWREIENMNLIFTIADHPLLGEGFGHQYREAIPLPDISSQFQMYRYHPHNAVLGLWAFGGLIGFSGMWVMLAVCVFLAARSYRCSSDPAERAAALAVIAAVIIYTNQVWGDMGQVSWTGVFLVAPAMAVAGKLAVASGAWPRTLPRTSSAAPLAAAVSPQGVAPSRS